MTLDVSGKAVDATVGAIVAALGRGESVNVIGFGAFSVTERPERTGRNPRTGTEIVISASKAPKLTPGKKLKDAVNA